METAVGLSKTKAAEIRDGLVKEFSVVYLEPNSKRPGHDRGIK